MHRVLGVDILQRGLPTEAMAFVVAVVVAAVTVFRELPHRVLHQVVLLFPPLHVDTTLCPLRSPIQAHVRSNVFLCSIAYLTQTHVQPHLHRHQPMHVPGLARQYL